MQDDELSDILHNLIKTYSLLHIANKYCENNCQDDNNTASLSFLLQDIELNIRKISGRLDKYLLSQNMPLDLFSNNLK